MSVKTVLILGAGINGAAIARELLLNGISVCLVDSGDIAAGATAYSSRLIHGGLRYLEHGEFRLVRESLAERCRLLRLAPQFVRPLELFIPVHDRTSGLAAAALRFFGLGSKSASQPSRGLWLLRIGLGLYDFLARSDGLPRHAVHALPAAGLPPVDPHSFRWLCSYLDAQVRFPERLVIAMLEDARRLAVESGLSFDVWTYHSARLNAKRVDLHPASRSPTEPARSPVASFEPAAIVNATGAWIDQTLQRLAVPSRRLIGGTKGSHFLTHHAGLRAALSARGIYATAADGRPVFLLPLGGATLVGTTDLPFDGSPETAVATDAELDYLAATVRHVFPDLGFDRDDVGWHYSGVRPLPFVDTRSPASITRRHFIEHHADSAIPLFSILGGKLTTARSLAEETAGCVLAKLGLAVTRNSRERPLPGAEQFPQNPEELSARQAELVRRTGLTANQVRAGWDLCGTSAEQVLSESCGPVPRTEPSVDLTPTAIPVALARSVIRREWVTRLSDLVERRLMLLYDEQVHRATLEQLARLMVEAGKLGAADVEAEVSACCERLRSHYGKRLD